MAGEHFYVEVHFINRGARRDSKVERNRDPLQSFCIAVPKAMKLLLDPAF